MKKTMKGLTLASLLAVLLCGCGGKSDPNTLTIKGVKLGYGTKWMEDIIQGFQAKTGKKVKLKTYDGQAGIESLQGVINAGGDNTDIFFTKITGFYKLAYQNYFEDLTDVYTEKDTSTGLSIEDRTNAHFLKAYKVDDKYVGISWANGVFGILKNNTLWKAMGLTDEDIPYTTEELYALCDKVVAMQYKYNNQFDISPMVYSYESEYYSTLFPTWFSQYEGSENMAYFNEGIDPDDPIGSQEHYTSNFYVREGITESLNVIYDLVVKNKDYQHPRSKTYQFSIAQNDFLRNKVSLMMVNGSWLETETSVTDYDVEFMDTPIISSIIDNGRITTIKDDATLSKVVKYCRGVTTEKPAGVSDSDIEVVKDAIKCGSLCRSGVDHQMVVSKKSKNIELAKEFIKYMYSDEGLAIYRKTMNGGVLATSPSKPFTDDTEISAFKANVNKKIEEDNFTDYEIQVPSKIFCYGGINRYCTNGLGNFGNNALKAMVDFKKTPQDVFNLNKKFLDDNWASILKEAGLQ